MEIDVAIGPPAVKFHNSSRPARWQRSNWRRWSPLLALSCRNMGQSWEPTAYVERRRTPPRAGLRPNDRAHRCAGQPAAATHPRPRIHGHASTATHPRPRIHGHASTARANATCAGSWGHYFSEHLHAPHCCNSEGSGSGRKTHVVERGRAKDPGLVRALEQADGCVGGHGQCLVEDIRPVDAVARQVRRERVPGPR